MYEKVIEGFILVQLHVEKIRDPYGQPLIASVSAALHLYLPYSKAWLLEVADLVCDLEKPSLAALAAG